MSPLKRIPSVLARRRGYSLPQFNQLEGRRLLCAGADDCTEAPTRAVVAVDAGGPGAVNSSGERFKADAGFEGGVAITLSGTIAKTADDALYVSAREGRSFNFSTRVPNGRYTLELRFADDQKTIRRFNIFAEDQLIASNWRVPTSMTAVDRKFNVEVKDLRFSLGFEAVAGKAIISAIMLTPGASIFPNGISWRAQTNLPLVREEAQSFVFEDRLYVLGGYVNTPEFAATTRFDRYDPATAKWQRMADMPTKFTHAGVAVDLKTQTAWFVGGYIGDFPIGPGGPDGSSVTWKYHIPTNTWSAGKSLPLARGAGGAAIIGRKLYYFGGANKLRTADQGSHWALDLDNPTKWRERSPLPNPRNHFGTVVVKDQIYVVGGQHLLELESTNQADVHRYDVTTDTWSAIASMPRPFSHFTFSTDVFNNRYIVLAGGESPHDVGRRDMYVFDTRRGLWGELTDLPANRRAAAAGIINGKLYVVSGYDREMGQTAGMWSAELLPAFT